MHPLIAFAAAIDAIAHNGFSGTGAETLTRLLRAVTSDPVSSHDIEEPSLLPAFAFRPSIE
jgi:hypothetical protein